MRPDIRRKPQTVRGLEGTIEELNGVIKDRDHSIDVLEQAAVSREHDFAALRKRFSWLQVIPPSMFLSAFLSLFIESPSKALLLAPVCQACEVIESCKRISTILRLYATMCVCMWILLMYKRV